MHHALKEGAQFREAISRHFVIAVSLHAKIAFRARAEKLRLLASRSDEPPSDFCGVVFGLSVAHPECGGLFGLAQYMRHSEIISPDHDLFGKATLGLNSCCRR
jgi:hypothetical protein